MKELRAAVENFGGPGFAGTLDLLQTSLQLAVPLHVAELLRLPIGVVLAFAAEDAQIVAERGDIIMWGSKKKGETAKAFNALARGIAALTFVQPVKALGLEFPRTPHPGFQTR